MTKPLKERLIAKIKAEGPLSVAEYMTICLLDPVHGYYPTRDPLGSDGDFITAPEISQMFGCLLYTSPSPRDQRGSRMPSSA